jgi:hypothetical protein
MGPVAHPATTSAHAIVHVAARARNIAASMIVGRISRTRFRFVTPAVAG